MKAQIGVRIQPLNGYLNMDAAANPNESDRVLCDPMNIDNLIDANELEELIISEIIDYLPLPARAKCLNHLLTRISHNGTVVITGSDPYEIARLVHSGQLDVQTANSIIYGMGKKSMTRPDDVIGIAMNTGQFTLVGVKYSQQHPFQYIVKLQRR